MAKNPAGFEDRAKVKVRFIEFELEGGNAAVENSVRNLTNALTQKNGVGSISKQPPTLKGIGTAPALLQTPSLADPLDEPDSLEEAPGADAAAVAAEASSPAKPRGTRKFTVPEVIDIDLISLDVPFAKYCEDKNLNTNWNKYLACAAWLKEHRNIAAITDDHIYTMFKFMKWSLTADVAAPLREMKKQGWFTTPERGKYAINHLGENEVNRMSSAA
jgi:hypothetical protein